MTTTKDGGILSQTLAPGPCIKAILSARIRNPVTNDVVMVGYSSVHLREFTQSGQLTNVIAELELGVQILAARVVSAEAYLLPLPDALLENGKDEVHFKIRGQPYDETKPPQIVVLSVASSDFIFLYAKNLPNGEVQFIHARRSILGNLPLPRAYGKHLAIDKGSKALAVAASKGSFGIMSLRDVDDLQGEIDKWDPRDPASLRPFKEQRFVQVDGMIIRMDFLKSSNNDPNRVVLLLIVANQGVTRLLLYKWDSSRSLSTLRPSQRSGHQLPQSDSFPHLLIPSCRNSSFAIVVGQFIVFYDDIETQNLRRLEANLEIRPGDTDKHWVQWAKPIRLEEYRKQKEDIYIIREDGLLRTILGSHNLSKRFSATVQPGHLEISIDTAVCALSAPPTVGGDILIACGDTTQGGVFHIAARRRPRLMQILPNWSPINDFVHMERTSTASEQASIVAATGIHDDCSALTELRYGMQADVIWTSKYEEARSIDRVWALEQRSENQLLLLASHHEHTSVLIYNIDTGDISAVDGSVFEHLCFDRCTLAAAVTPQDIIIQIARNSINTSTPHRDSQNCIQGRAIEELICADIHQQTGIWAAAERRADTIVLIGGGVQLNEMDVLETPAVPNPLQILTIPIALSLTIIGGHLICLIAVQEGGFQLYSVHPEDGFCHQSTWSLAELEPALLQPQISAITLLCFPNATNALLVCGLKTGAAVFLTLKLVDDGVNVSASLRIERTMSLGATAVVFRNEATIFLETERAAYIICGSSLFRLVLYNNTAGLDFTVNQIFIVNRELSPSSPAMITAIDRVGRFPRAASSSENDPSGALVVVSGADLSMLTLGPPTMLPRHIRSIGATRHLVHSPHLDKYIVSHQTRMPKGSPKARSPQMERPSLILIDANSAPAGDDLPVQRTHFHFGEKNEKVRVLMHWTPADDASHYNMIVIGSDLDNDGRVSYMNESKMVRARSNPSAKVIATYPKKSIGAICAYGMSSLVICAGRELKILHLDLANRRWTSRGEFELPSRATELTTKGSVIYVATSLHSFLLIREKDGKLDLVGSDQWASRARNIVTYGGSSTLINLVSDHGSRILNFVDRPTQGSKSACEARLPQAIDKMAHLRLTTTSDNRQRFLGTTIDGTVYLFSTLTETEMRLMRFLEQLCEPIRLQIAKNASRLAQSIANKYAKKLESENVAAPVLVETHARGDLLKALLVQGPYNIRFLLQKRANLEDGMVKHEDEMGELIDLAQPVIGTVDDVIDGVILWLRRTLNVPAF